MVASFLSANVSDEVSCFPSFADKLSAIDTSALTNLLVKLARKDEMDEQAIETIEEVVKKGSKS